MEVSRRNKHGRHEAACEQSVHIYTWRHRLVQRSHEELIDVHIFWKWTEGSIFRQSFCYYYYYYYYFYFKRFLLRSVWLVAACTLLLLWLICRKNWSVNKFNSQSQQTSWSLWRHSVWCFQVFPAVFQDFTNYKKATSFYFLSPESQSLSCIRRLWNLRPKGTH